MHGRRWWQSAVFYEVYARSYADANGDGVGDLAGIRQRLDHVQALGADALWLTPFYPSPMADHGYDVADPREVDPVFGTTADFSALVEDVHARGMRLLVDVVPNHTSTAHPWFQAALSAGPGSAERARYLFRDGLGGAPPNNWRSVFGGPAWTRVPDGQWYLHLFDRGQPDLDWRNPEVGDDAERTLRFWLDAGVDGFRIDVAHGLFKDPALPDVSDQPSLMDEKLVTTPLWNRPEVHEVYRRWHKICEQYSHDPCLMGEVWLGDAQEQARYVRPDELHLVFNFRLLFCAWDAAEMRRAIDRSVTALRAVGAPSTWVLSNHDVVRHVTRYGGGALGLARARAALLLVLALPGPVVLYQGEELGLPEAEVPDEALQDPIWERSRHTARGRDGCRVPLPWSGDAPPYGFGDAAGTWLPQPDGWGALTVAAQDRDPDSTLAFYRKALSLRPSAEPLGEVHWHRRDGDVLDLAVAGGVRCVVNLGRDEVDLRGGTTLLASGDLPPGRLPPDTAVWLV